MLHFLRWDIRKNIHKLTLLCLLIVCIFIDSYQFLRVLPFSPFLSLIVLFYCCVNLPSPPSYSFVFMCGLLLDCLSGSYIGHNALLFLVVDYVGSHEKTFLARSSFLEWLGFGGLLGASLLVEAGLFYLVHHVYTLGGQNLLDGISTFLLYGPLHGILRFLGGGR